MSDQAALELSIRDYAQVVARRKAVVLAAAMASIVAAMIMSVLQDPIYETSALILVRARDNATVFTNTQSASSSTAAVVGTEIQVLESAVVGRRVQTDLSLETSIPRVKGTQVDVTDVVRASVRSGDAVTAKVLADAYARSYVTIKREQAVSGLLEGSEEISVKLAEIRTRIDEIDEEVASTPAESKSTVESRLAPERKILVDQQGVFKQRLDQLQVDSQLVKGSAQLLREADIPTEPIQPRPIRAFFLALVIGLIIGLCAAFLLDYLDNSIRTPEELQTATGGLPLLATVAHEDPPDVRPLSVSRPKSWTVENYRELRTSLQFLSLDKDIRTIQFTSAGASEGKSTSAVNTAIAFAQAGFRTLLIDADLRKPRQHAFFGLTPESGLVEVLVGTPFASCVVRIISNLDLLEAGSQPPNPSEMLSSRQMSRLLQQLRNEYDMIIIDSSPILLVSDGVGLSSSVDAVVLVARADKTSGPQVESAIARLRSVDAPLVGTVFNDVVRRKTSMYGYVYGYGTPVGASSSTET